MLAHGAKLALCLALAAWEIGCGGASAQGAAACGPFGDPPATIIAAVKPDCGSGRLLGPWNDADGTARYACLYEPASAAANNELPLLVFLHPSLFSAGTTLRHTNLLGLAETVSLSGDPKRIGFIVLAPQGRRTTHFYPFPDNRGIGWDNWYRQLSPAGAVKVGATVYPENVDAATIDHFIAQAVRGGKVNPRRVYVTGWSNGAAMGYLYALNRPSVAAVAVYSGPDPFGAFDDPCSQTPVTGVPANDAQVRIFNPRVPMMQVYNSCDVAGLCPNGEKLTAELRKAGAGVRNVIIDSSGNQVDACAGWCGTNPNGDENPLFNPIGWTVGLHRHSRWPAEQAPAMLEFLRNHPLQPNRGSAPIPF